MRTFRVKVNDNVYEVEIEEISTGNTVLPPAQSTTATLEKPRTPAAPVPPAAAAKAVPQANQDSGNGIVTAQMPGTVVEIHVHQGDKVSRGQKLLILEAMKMENEIVAPTDGIVRDIQVAKGASVNAGDILVILN